MQAHPGVEFAQFAREFVDAARAQVGAVGRSVLRDDEQLFHAEFDQVLRFFQHGIGRAAHQTAAQVGDDAEGAVVVAAFGDFQVGVVARREFQPGGRDEVEVGVVRRFGQVFVYRAHHRFVGLRPGDGEDVRAARADDFGFDAKAAGNDDFAVLPQRFADGVERFGDGFVDKAAGINDDEVGVVVTVGDGVAVGVDLGEDALGIDQRFRAAEADEADGGLFCSHDDARLFLGRRL